MPGLRSDDRTTRTLQGVVRAALDEHRVPGIVAAVCIDDEFAQAAAGTNDPSSRTTLEVGTRLRAASLTKPMVATLVVQLAAQGLLSLDDRVRRHLSTFALADESAADQVTIRDVLSHRGGWVGDFLPADVPDGAQSFSRHMALMRDLPQLTRPGTLMSYCNSGYALLGHVCEVVSGESFEDLMQRVLFGPLGMAGAQVGVSTPVAPGHARRGSEYVAVSVGTETLPRFSASAGGVTATIADVVLFARPFAGAGRSAPLHLLDEMLVAHADSVGTQNLGDQIGLGWMLRSGGGNTMLSHTGDTLGHHVIVVAMPCFAFACAVGVNAQGGDEAAEDVVGRIFTALTGATLPEAEYTANETNAASAEQVAGRYESSLAITTLSCTEPGRVALTVERKSLPMGVAESFELAGTLRDDVIVLDSRRAGGRVRVIRNADAITTHLRIEGRLAERIA